MQNISLNTLKRGVFNNSSLHNCLINGTFHSIQNSNFNIISRLNSNLGKRNLTFNTKLYPTSCINTITSSINLSNNLISPSLFKQHLVQTVRCFSKTNHFLDNKSNPPGQDKVKIETEKFLIGFTCKKCNNRSYKLISKKSYYEGVVIIRCDKCKNLHLIADHLGWYDSMNKFGTIEDYFKRQKSDSSGNKTIIKKDLQQLTQTEQNDVIEFLKEEQKELEEKEK